ncbi:MAG: hypothetical protein IT355_14595 [Gemmatimonadaceae bacterium]|nr:hypothetical protein [Gemmatimonadaceae bacterium]
MPFVTRCRTLLAILLLASQPGCRRDAPAPPPRTSVEIKGTAAERIAAVQKMLRVPPALAATILDAQAMEERVGDGRLGPADFAGFQVIRVAPGHVAEWRTRLTPVTTGTDAPAFVEPSTPVSWWVSGPEFASLDFFAPEALTGRTTGWIGVHAASGTIYIYSFTM